MAANESDHDPLEEDARVGSLEERLKRAQIRERNRTGQRNRGPDENQRLGMRVLSYLIGGVAAGFFMGWILDGLFGTTPLFLLLFFFLGIGVAFWRIYAISTQATRDAQASEQSDDQGLR